MTIRLAAPKEFSTAVDIAGVLEYITKFKSVEISNKAIVYLNFRRVRVLDAGAMAMVLSVAHDLESQGVKVIGSKPVFPPARKIFNDSGILEHFIDGRGRHRACTNHLIQGRGKTLQMDAAIETVRAMETVFGKRAYNRPIQTALIEMMANSVNHAFPAGDDQISTYLELFLEEKPWYLSVFHDPEGKKVFFSFVDNGVGIINTIRRRFGQLVADQVDDTRILHKAFSGEYRSRTQQAERGKGLVSIREVSTKRSVRQLKVVTNNHLYDFETGSGTKLANSFEGTVYFWTLDDTCNHGNSEN
ncbi:hypothetical protein EPD60_16680 [Flaviaesturariibacter flavus]|uniref:STAS domain-containing protein n=1 Tax=Flaviaesturariibacter flavus TaxID=2502780 RepID=A0A4R1B8D6_9BACT|nr:hypothetical protein [Flaviaesturariibacter flavus]TCJ12179.1 hypothetical protein EPD60_16680 [Flaviaesturariibacter flavus]